MTHSVKTARQYGNYWWALCRNCEWGCSDVDVRRVRKMIDEHIKETDDGQA